MAQSKELGSGAWLGASLSVLARAHLAALGFSAKSAGGGDGEPKEEPLTPCGASAQPSLTLYKPPRTTVIPPQDPRATRVRPPHRPPWTPPSLSDAIFDKMLNSAEIGTFPSQEEPGAGDRERRTEALATASQAGGFWGRGSAPERASFSQMGFIQSRNSSNT